LSRTPGIQISNTIHAEQSGQLDPQSVVVQHQVCLSSARNTLAGKLPWSFGLAMPEKIVTCDECGQPAVLSFGEGGFGWWESLSCPSCGNAYEADGHPPTPDDYRQVILREQGPWTLDAPLPATMELLRALRAVLSLSLSATQELRNRLPGEIRHGTRFEMNQILDAVQRQMGPSGLIVRPLVTPNDVK
jgi:hypothetical protein